MMCIFFFTIQLKMERHVGKVRAACANVSRRHAMPWMPSDLQVRTGTCVFVTDLRDPKRTLALTCAHVVVNAAKSSGVFLRFPRVPDAKVRAEVECLFPELDLAVLRVMASEHDQLINPVAWGDDLKLTQGERLLAGGYALSYDDFQTASLRYVARNREHNGKLQCDGAANPGHSGGPVLRRQKDDSFELIGLVQSKASGKAISNVVYVMPVSHIVSALQSSSRADVQYLRTLPFLLHDNTQAYNSMNKIPSSEGACICNSHCKEAPNGSVLLSLNDWNVTKKAIVQAPYGNISTGDWIAQNCHRTRVPIRLWNKATGKIETPTVSLKDFTINGMIHNSFENTAPEYETWGITVCDIRQEHVVLHKVSYVTNDELRKGMIIVANMLPNSVASETCIKVGDIVRAVNDVAITTIEEYRRQVRESGQYVALTLQCSVDCVKLAVLNKAEIAQELKLHKEHGIPPSVLFAPPPVKIIDMKVEHDGIPPSVLIARPPAKITDMKLEQECVTASYKPNAIQKPSLQLEVPCSVETTDTTKDIGSPVAVQRDNLPPALRELF